MDFEKIVSAYEKNPSIRGVAIALNISHTTVRKTLITRGILKYKKTEEAVAALNRGETISAIADEWGCSRNTVHSYLPYTKGAYKEEHPSQNALRIRKHREKRIMLQVRPIVQ